MALRPNENKPESGLRHQYLSHRLLRSLQLKSDMKRLALSIGMALFCQSASAGIYSDCKQAVSNGDIEKATEFATKMLGFNSVSMEHREEGAACLTYAMGEEYVYSVGLNAFATKIQDAEFFDSARKATLDKAAEESKATLDKAAEEKKNQDALDAATRLALQAELDDKAARQKRTSEVWTRASEACNEMYADDPNSTITNQLCLNIFLETGLPQE